MTSPTDVSTHVADEIERLRAEIERLQFEYERADQSAKRLGAKWEKRGEVIAALLVTLEQVKLRLGHVIVHPLAGQIDAVLKLAEGE